MTSFDAETDLKPIIIIIIIIVIIIEKWYWQSLQLVKVLATF